MDNNDCRWPVPIGTTESGEGRYFDYVTASNILVTGAPKQGKSTAIRINSGRPQELSGSLRYAIQGHRHVKASWGCGRDAGRVVP